MSSNDQSKNQFQPSPRLRSISLDYDSKSPDYVYGEWHTLVIWIIKPGTLGPVFEAHEANEAICL